MQPGCTQVGARPSMDVSGGIRVLSAPSPVVRKKGECPRPWAESDESSVKTQIEYRRDKAAGDLMKLAHQLETELGFVLGV